MNFESWEWPTGVGIYGLYKYYEISNKSEYLDFMIKWFDARLADGLPPKNVN
jgi:unsaturated rhamnogalacturonyl hydrolase